MPFVRSILTLLFLLLSPMQSAHAGDGRYIYLGSTTTTYDSGLLSFLLPQFEEITGIEVRPIVRGTGQILKLGKRGDIDLLIVHDRASEEEFVESGYGIHRQEVMYNDFVLLGPRSDPAGVRQTKDIGEALELIAKTEALFLSRGDNSGTHKREMELWSDQDIKPQAMSLDWYRETGSGMGATLNNAVVTGAYLLADRATWTAFRNKRDLAILFEGGENLRNVYSIILVDDERHPHIKKKEALLFRDWITSREGQKAIADFRLDGQQLFFPSALKSQELRSSQ
ncbi:MAG: substrate-binding domain-containing protein [Kiloniellales bacterium]|nr:substrate-binding domain-containing protein [Kiloniellales bacterium]